MDYDQQSLLYWACNNVHIVSLNSLIESSYYYPIAMSCNFFIKHWWYKICKKILILMKIVLLWPHSNTFWFNFMNEWFSVGNRFVWYLTWPYLFKKWNFWIFGTMTSLWRHRGKSSRVQKWHNTVLKSWHLPLPESSIKKHTYPIFGYPLCFPRLFDLFLFDLVNHNKIISVLIVQLSWRNGTKAYNCKVFEEYH